MVFGICSRAGPAGPAPLYIGHNPHSMLQPTKPALRGFPVSHEEIVSGNFACAYLSDKCLKECAESKRNADHGPIIDMCDDSIGFPRCYWCSVDNTVAQAVGKTSQRANEEGRTSWLHDCRDRCGGTDDHITGENDLGAFYADSSKPIHAASFSAIGESQGNKLTF